jgi:hypothetical protein
MRSSFLRPILSPSGNISGNSSDPLRSKIHFNLPTRFMNDPNGSSWMPRESIICIINLSSSSSTSSPPPAHPEASSRRRSPNRGWQPTMGPRHQSAKTLYHWTSQPHHHLSSRLRPRSLSLCPWTPGSRSHTLRSIFPHHHHGHQKGKTTKYLNCRSLFISRSLLRCVWWGGWKTMCVICPGGG